MGQCVLSPLAVLTKFYEGVRSGHGGDFLPMLLVEFSLQVLQIREGKLFRECCLTEHQIDHSLLYSIATRNTKLETVFRDNTMKLWNKSENVLHYPEGKRHNDEFCKILLSIKNSSWTHWKDMEPASKVQRFGLCSLSFRNNCLAWAWYCCRSLPSYTQEIRGENSSLKVDQYGQTVDT